MWLLCKHEVRMPDHLGIMRFIIPKMNVRILIMRNRMGFLRLIITGGREGLYKDGQSLPIC